MMVAPGPSAWRPTIVPRDTPKPTTRLLPLALLALLFGALVGPMAALEARRTDIPAERGVGYPSELMDQDLYHWEVIQGMDAQWPRPDVARYPSATSPGYHLLQTAVYRITGERAALVAANALIGFGLIAALYVAIAPLAGGWGAAAFCLPLMLSPYTLGGAIWMTTDNLALLFVVLAIGGALLRPFTKARALRTGFYAACAVFVRQIHVWTAAPIGLAAVLASPLAAIVPGPLRSADETKRSWPGLVVGAIGALLPFAVLGWLFWLWGGLLPIDDEIRAKHGAGWNPASFAFGLGVVGVLGMAFVPLVLHGIRTLRPTDVMAWLVAGAGLVAAVAVPTSHVKRFRDNGWIWSIVERAPDVADRSVVLLVLAPLGAVILLLLCRGAKEAGRGPAALAILLTFLGWLCAQSMNATAWQRYFEQPILIMLAMLGALFYARTRRPIRLAGVVLLAGFELALSAATMYREFLGKVL